MKSLTFSIFILVVSLISCDSFQRKSTQVAENSKTKSIINENQSKEIISLLRDMYQWLEEKSEFGDFEPLAGKDPDRYIGIDFKKHEQRIFELKKTDYFTKAFINNYDQIARKIDVKLKNKEIEWLKGDLPPFGNDASPWTNTQDISNEYWKNIHIFNFEQNGNKASFSWSSDNDFEYKIVVERMFGKWKIESMEGFNIKEYP